MKLELVLVLVVAALNIVSVFIQCVNITSKEGNCAVLYSCTCVQILYIQETISPQ